MYTSIAPFSGHKIDHQSESYIVAFICLTVAIINTPKITNVSLLRVVLTMLLLQTRIAGWLFTKNDSVI
jgi:hypothetical protein